MLTADSAISPRHKTPATNPVEYRTNNELSKVDLGAEHHIMSC